MLSPDSMLRSLEDAGFARARVSTGRFDHQHDPGRFVELRVSQAEPWLSSLVPEQRDEFLRRVRTRLAGMPSESFRDPTEILFAQARVE